MPITQERFRRVIDAAKVYITQDERNIAFVRSLQKDPDMRLVASIVESYLLENRPDPSHAYAVAREDALLSPAKMRANLSLRRRQAIFRAGKARGVSLAYQRVMAEGEKE